MEAFVDHLLVVQDVVQDLAVRSLQAVSILAGYTTFVVEQTVGRPAPTDVFLRWHFPDGTIETTFAPELSSGFAVYKTYQFPSEFTGTHPLTVDAYNLVSEEILHTDFSVEETIQVSQMSAMKDGLAVG